jgi:hypothetical protein
VILEIAAHPRQPQFCNARGAPETHSAIASNALGSRSSSSSVFRHAIQRPNSVSNIAQRDFHRIASTLNPGSCVANSNRGGVAHAASAATRRIVSSASESGSDSIFAGKHK